MSLGKIKPMSYLSKLHELAELVKKSEYIVVLTGAGISTESGLPDFTGLGKNEPVMQAIHPDLGAIPNRAIEPQRGPENFSENIHQRGPSPNRPIGAQSGTVSMEDAKPNRGHYALVELQKMGKLKFLITMNLEGLHLDSGIDPSKLSELHGNVKLLKCTVCNKKVSKKAVGWDDRIHGYGFKTEAEKPGRPLCPNCNGKLLSSEVNYGDSMPEDELSTSISHAKNADLFIAIGTSLTTSPANSLPDFTLANNGKFVLMTRGETPKDSQAHIKITENVGQVMEDLLKKLKGN
jgi:NAD-dependent SIR2 family protein deacetylase